MAATPRVILLAGANGAGKTTAAPALLRGLLRVTQYVNADTIARGLAGFDPDDAALAAGRIMLERIRELAARRVSFAIETTLASRTLAAWLRDDVRPAGYESHLLFLWLPSVEVALARVEARVRAGGHGVPPDTVRRRYTLGIRNFRRLYVPIVDEWRVYNSVSASGPRLVARGRRGEPANVVEAREWRRFNEQSEHP